MPELRRLLRILGKRAFVTFGVVTFLVAALLATVNITSRYALKLYVEDQLQRIPWDVAVYQRGSASDSIERIRSRVAGVRGVERVESLAFLRARFPEGDEVIPAVGGKPLATPWLCLLAASDLSILPPELGFALAHNRREHGGTDDSGSVLALVGPERAMGPAFRSLQGAKEFTFKVNLHKQERLLFSTPLQGVVRLDRDELNRWLMDQTGSVSYIPYIGVIVLMKYDADVLQKFDQVATGIVPDTAALPGEVEAGQGGVDYGHVQMAEYEPEIIYLSRLDRAALISGWDIAGSLARVADVNRRIHTGAIDAAHARRDPDEPPPIEHSSPTVRLAGYHPSAGGSARPFLRLVHDAEEEEEGGNGMMTLFVDSTTEVLLGRMEGISRLIGVVALLVSLPLLWMGWVLAANLSGLLMLNERRTLGLMRLRGIPGKLLGRALLVAIVGGGLVGGVLGLTVGSVLPLIIYEHGRLPLSVLRDAQQLLLLLGFLAITVVLALLVSRKLVRYATTISPLEASGRVAASEATRAALTFGPLPALALLLGTYVLVAGWIFDVTVSGRLDAAWARYADRLLDFLGMPLFLYGVTTLLASKRTTIQRVMTPLIRPVGGSLGRFAVQHLSVKPHRTVAFLLIVALMASVSLYPTITSRSFADKAARGARVQLGGDLQLLFNAPDFADVSKLKGGVGDQLAAMRPELDRIVADVKRVSGVRNVTYMLESVLPTFYLPGYGLKGVPLYLVGDPEAYRRDIYSEPQVGLSKPFNDIIDGLPGGDVAVSPPVSDFWRLSNGKPMLLGLDVQRRAVESRSSGMLAFLPGIPPRTVSDRQGYVQARVDYLNFLFSSNAYMVASAVSPKLASLDVLIPRVILLVTTDGAAASETLQASIVKALPFPPLEVHNLSQEVAKVGSDMFISLALANMRIYLVGGLLLALIAILSIAMANYTEDRRTLALLRIRGASPGHLWRFIVALLLSPAVLGLILGSLTALLAGFGLANYVWKLREIKTVVQFLPTRLVVSTLTGGVLVLLVVLLMAVASGFSWWVFRRTAHQGMQEA